MTATSAGSPRYFPVSSKAKSISVLPPPLVSRIAPKITNRDMYTAAMLVNAPHIPSVEKKAILSK
jgi:hypothetical protein